MAKKVYNMAELIKILLQAFGRAATERELINIMYYDNSNHENVNSELKKMIKNGYIVRTGQGTSTEPYYYDLSVRVKSNYYVVFQDKSFLQGLSHGYLWVSEENESLWKSMDTVHVGDVIFFGYKQNIVAVAIATSNCYSLSKSIEFSEGANTWEQAGRRVNVDYYPFDRTIRYAEHMDSILNCYSEFKDRKFHFNLEDNMNTEYMFKINEAMANVLMTEISSFVSPMPKESAIHSDIKKVEKKTDLDTDMEIEALLSEQQDKVIDSLVKQFIKKLPKILPREQELELLREKFVSDFTMNKLMNMTKEEYVVGLGSKDSFCYRLETELEDLGNIKGATSAKFGLYYGKSGDDTEDKYRFTKKYGINEDEALHEIKKQIVYLLMDGEKKDLDAIRNCELAPLFRGKILAVFFPEEYLCIFTDEHLEYFLKKLNIYISDDDDILTKQQKLVEWKKSRKEMSDWNNHTFSTFLYQTFGRPFEVQKAERDLQNDRDKEYPRDYVTSLGITINQWKTMLQNPKIFKKEDIEFLKRIYLSDNHATSCYDLSIQDGISPTSYITPIVNLAKRIANEMGMQPIKEGDRTIWWRIPFWGRYREDTRFEWKLRPKLAKAMEAVFKDLSADVNTEIEEQEDNELVASLKNANVAKEDRFEYTGEPKEKTAPVYTNGHKIYPRDRHTAINALVHANYLCEISSNHPTFIRKNSGKNYTEPHHLVPMAFSEQFSVSLDVEENIVSLCSNCHNQIHYGADADKLIKKLYEERKDALATVGIVVTLEQLLAMYRY